MSLMCSSSASERKEGHLARRNEVLWSKVMQIDLYAQCGEDRNACDDEHYTVCCIAYWNSEGTPGGSCTTNSKKGYISINLMTAPHRPYT